MPSEKWRYEPILRRKSNPESIASLAVSVDLLISLP